jgi:hypothetical protein
VQHWDAVGRAVGDLDLHARSLYGHGDRDRFSRNR